MIGSILLALSQVSSPPVAAVARPTKAVLHGDFSCSLVDRERKNVRLSGSIIDYEPSDGKDRVIIELDVENDGGFSGVYYGYVNGDAIIMRNFVNFDSHLQNVEDRWADILLWFPKETEGTLIVEVHGRESRDFLPRSLTGFCELNFEKTYETITQ